MKEQTCRSLHACVFTSMLKILIVFHSFLCPSVIFFYFSFTTGFSFKKDALFWNSFLTIKLLRPRCLLSSFFFFKIYQYVIGSYVFIPPCLYFVLFINYFTFFSSVYFLTVVTAWFITFSSHERLWKTLLDSCWSEFFQPFKALVY